jgi:hypothetical protein
MPTIIETEFKLKQKEFARTKGEIQMPIIIEIKDEEFARTIGEISH